MRTCRFWWGQVLSTFLIAFVFRRFVSVQGSVRVSFRCQFFISALSRACSGCCMRGDATGSIFCCPSRVGWHMAKAVDRIFALPVKGRVARSRLDFDRASCCTASSWLSVWRIRACYARCAQPVTRRRFLTTSCTLYSLNGSVSLVVSLLLRGSD